MKRRMRAAVLFASALAGLAQTSFTFRVRGNRGVAAATRVAMQAEPADDSSARLRNDDVWLAFRAVSRAKRLWPARVMCLQTALVTQRVLEKQGIASTLTIGASGSENQLKAHAWIELGDYVIDDQRIARRFLTLEQPGLRASVSTAERPVP